MNPLSGGTPDGCFPVSPTLREQSRTFTAPADGWLFVIVDGGSTGLREHRGYYTLQARLVGCDDPACGC